MKPAQTSQLAVALVMIGLAGFMTWRWWNNNREHEPKAWFYDLSEGKLFVASQNAVPPILGTDGKVEDAVRAVVYAPTGDCDKEKKIAYLEKYSPELKAQFERAKREPNVDFERMPRAMAQSHTFVQRVGEGKWHTMDSEEALKVVGEWRLTISGDKEPTICIP